jgi:hypothetical protein
MHRDCLRWRRSRRRHSRGRFGDAAPAHLPAGVGPSRARCHRGCEASRATPVMSAERSVKRAAFTIALVSPRGAGHLPSCIDGAREARNQTLPRARLADTWVLEHLRPDDLIVAGHEAVERAYSPSDAHAQRLRLEEAHMDLRNHVAPRARRPRNGSALPVSA